MPESRTTALGTTRVLARFAADIRYEDLPAEAVATLKKLFLDTVADVTQLSGLIMGRPAS
jgi:2-methylcitrate dehydratase PrpD